MARRQRRRKVASSGSLDSFLDIVTNSLGLLILVALLSAFSAQGVKISLGTPMMREVDSGLEIVHFQVINGRVLPIEFEQFDSRLQEFYGEYADQAALAARFNSDRLSNGFHAIEFDAAAGGSYVLTPVSEEAGDPVEALDEASSDFRTRLEELDPDRHWVFFIVTADSFGPFREFRDYVKQQGFQVGWLPYAIDKPLRFSPYGRNINQID